MSLFFFSAMGIPPKISRPSSVESRFQIQPHSGANTTRVNVDIDAIDVDIAVGVDIGGKAAVIAGRPKPPPRSRTVCVVCYAFVVVSIAYKIIITCAAFPY